MSEPTLSKRLLAWYDTAKRDLPLRVPRGGCPPAYHVLVSEAMLQQTQVATVIPYFKRFLDEFPTLASLATAQEQRVLRLWQGLGYYSRARNLRKAAIAITQSHDGEIPRDVDSLLTLPGIGRYTAGAIVSLAYDIRAPILDGNVVRVLCRIDAIEEDPRTPTVQKRLWARAEELLPTKRVGDFNSALMELGATVCTPKNPTCLICPLNRQCKAFDQHLQNQIPVPKKAKPTPLHIRHVLCLRDAKGRYLIEQRPPTGRWAGMWQFITRETDDFTDIADRPDFKRSSLGTVHHALTHRRYEFRAHVAISSNPCVPPSKTRRWTTLETMEKLPTSRPHLKMRKMLEQL